MKRNLRLLLPSILSGFSVALTLYQLIPGNDISTKKWVLLILGFVAGMLIGAGLITFLERYFRCSKKMFLVFLVFSVIFSALCTGLFHLSFPQKEVFLDSQSISIRVQTAFFGKDDTGIKFLSLNNGYHGIAFSDFVQSGSWERQGDQLVLVDNAHKPALNFEGKTGRNVELFFLSGKQAGVVEIDWGDGISETVDLSRDTAEPFSLMVPHDFGQNAETGEKMNFFFNLLSVFIPFSFLTLAYLLILRKLLSAKTRGFVLVFLVLTAFTIIYRVISVYDFPLGWDEGTYSRAAMRYSEKILSFQWDEIPSILYNHEHPAFVKLMFSIPASLDGREAFSRFGWNTLNNASLAKEDYTIFTGRMISAIFSLWTVQAVCYLIHPLAGFFFMIDSLAAEYGAQARLEAIPMLFSFLSIWFFNEFLKSWQVKITRKTKWNLFASAVFLGLTAASKVIYCVIAFAMILVMLETLVRNRTRWKRIGIAMASMAVLSLLSFYIFNPSIWYAPVERLNMMLSFHERYQEKADEIYPVWQPVAWITRSVAHQSGRYFEKSPLAKAPQHFFFSCDELIFLLACLGAADLFRKQKIYGYWFIFGMVFLFLWGTKWEQYACIVVIPICIAAYWGARRIANWLIHSTT